MPHLKLRVNNYSSFKCISSASLSKFKENTNFLWARSVRFPDDGAQKPSLLAPADQPRTLLCAKRKRHMSSNENSRAFISEELSRKRAPERRGLARSSPDRVDQACPPSAARNHQFPLCTGDPEIVDRPKLPRNAKMKREKLAVFQERRESDPQNFYHSNSLRLITMKLPCVG